MNIFDSDYNTFRRFDLQDARRPESNQYISRILEVPGRTAGSRIFVGTGGNGIFVIDTGTRELLNEKRERLLESLPTEYIHDLFLDADRHLWVIPEGAEPLAILDADTLEPAEGISVEPGASPPFSTRTTSIASIP